LKRVVVLALLLLGCNRLRKTPPRAVDASAPAPAIAEPAPTTTMLEAKDLPAGHWESTEGETVAISLLPDALVRFITPVPHYRHGARVFGQVTHVEGDDPSSFRIWVDVTKIYAKEIGARHRWTEDFELYEAAILEQRVTSPNANGHHVPELGGQGPEPPASFTLRFDAGREHVELCTMAKRCRSLTKKKSPSDLSRVRLGTECKTDEDCTVVTDGEQCDPCLCPNKPSQRSWPTKKDPDKEDMSWERKPEHLCGKEITRKDTCPACPPLHAVCKHKACVLKP
jgi:hypothetical protein